MQSRLTARWLMLYTVKQYFWLIILIIVLIIWVSQYLKICSIVHVIYLLFFLRGTPLVKVRRWTSSLEVWSFFKDLDVIRNWRNVFVGELIVSFENTAKKMATDQVNVDNCWRKTDSFLRNIPNSERMKHWERQRDETATCNGC